MTAIATLLQAATDDLKDSDSARLDADLLLAHCLQCERTHLYAWPEREVSAAVESAFCALLKRRIAGEPVAYLMGYREFWSLPLRVSPATLIPRPDTETLVQQALQTAADNGQLRSVLDLGCGTGAIALALASERADLDITAVDSAADALALAQGNAAALGIDSVRFVESDWFSALSGQRFDLIVSNPPYVAADDPLLQQGDVRFEPVSALVADAGGLADLKRIVDAAADHLQAGGWIWLEHGHTQGPAVRELFSRQSCFKHIDTVTDIAGRERVTGACLSGHAA